MKIYVANGPLCEGDTAQVVVEGCAGELIVVGDQGTSVTLTEYGFDATAGGEGKYLFTVICIG